MALPLLALGVGKLAGKGFKALSKKKLLKKANPLSKKSGLFAKAKKLYGKLKKKKPIERQDYETKEQFAERERDRNLDNYTREQKFFSPDINVQLGGSTRTPKFNPNDVIEPYEIGVDKKSLKAVEETVDSSSKKASSNMSKLLLPIGLGIAAIFGIKMMTEKK